MVWGILWIVLTLLGVLALVANALSLFQGIRLRGRVRRSTRMAFGGFLPRVAVLLPVRGLDDGFDANLRAILSQDYPAYRLVAIADDSGDPALGRVRAIAGDRPGVPVVEVVSAPSELAGKVNALRTGLAHLKATDDAVVFADADIRPGRDWLRQLVQPLADVTVGGSTGFRWYVPPRPTFWSLVRSEWNAVSANVLFDPGRTYVWGGSCALRAEHLPRLRLEERWRGVLSDDLVLTRAIREAGLRIVYMPTALVATLEEADRRESTDWCLRQMTMAVLYHPGLRRYAAFAFAVFNGAVLLGVLSSVVAAVVDVAFVVSAALFLTTVPATVAKASIRRNAFLSAAPAVRAEWRAPAWRAAFASLAVPWLMAWGLLKTRRPTSVRWRGRRYDVRDPGHVRLLPAGSESRGNSK